VHKVMFTLSVVNLLAHFIQIFDCKGCSLAQFGRWSHGVINAVVAFEFVFMDVLCSQLKDWNHLVVTLPSSISCFVCDV
jgi:hypothetical protein